MIETKSGRHTDRLFRHFYYSLIFLANFFKIFCSQNFRKSIVQSMLRLMGHRKTPKCVIEAATNLMDPDCLKATYLMAREELNEVKQPKISIIKSNIDRLSMLYGENDDWVPVEFYQKIKKMLEFDPDQNGNDCSEIDLRLCFGQIDHAFVTKTEWSLEISKIVSNVIQLKWNLTLKDE
ncbi:hypothetical protein NH340_JMT07687 [Sarcoptes scabiei]|nr:hypothetical protein NH340_JMT07687 [Sarcoptes scabiei]